MSLKRIVRRCGCITTCYCVVPLHNPVRTLKKRFKNDMQLFSREPENSMNEVFYIYARSYHLILNILYNMVSTKPFKFVIIITSAHPKRNASCDAISW